MYRLHIYLFRQCVVILGGLLTLIVGILLLERLLRIADILSQSPGRASEAGAMMFNLVPHYLGIGIPAALFLAVLFTVNNLSRTGELVSMLSTGKSLFSISRPFFLLGILLALLSILVTGYLQPLSRYEYRKIVYSVGQSSVETMFQEGKFVTTNGWTVWTREVDRETGLLKDSFILDRRDPEKERYFVAATGRLKRSNGFVSEVTFDAGMGATIHDRRGVVAARGV